MNRKAFRPKLYLMHRPHFVSPNKGRFYRHAIIYLESIMSSLKPTGTSNRPALKGKRRSTLLTTLSRWKTTLCKILKYSIPVIIALISLSVELGVIQPISPPPLEPGCPKQVLACTIKV